MRETEPKRLWVVSLLLFIMGFGLNLWIAMTVSPTTCVAMGGSCQDTLAFGSCAVWILGIISLPFTVYVDDKNKTMIGWVFVSLIALLVIIISFFVFIYSIAICTGLDNDGYERVGSEYTLIRHKHLPNNEIQESYYTYFYKTGAFTYTYCYDSLDEEAYSFGDNSVVFSGGISEPNDIEINYSEFH